METFDFWICLIVLVSTSASVSSSTIGQITSDDPLKQSIKLEGKLYDEIKKVLLLETVLHELTKHSEVSLDAVPEKNYIRQAAIDKYTKGDLPQPKTPDEFWSGSNFKTFYQYLVQGIKPQTKFPNTRKTTSELQTLYDNLISNFNQFKAGGETLYEKKNKFSYPPELKKDNDRKKFHDALKKDVNYILAAFLQSFLIEQEQKEADIAKQTTLYRLQADFNALTATYVKDQIVCTDRLTSTSRPENSKTFLTLEETRSGDGHTMEKHDWELVNKVKMTITKPKDKACGVHLPKTGPYHTGFHSYQREVLLPIGTCFKITKKDPIYKTGTNQIDYYDIRMRCTTLAPRGNKP